MMKLRVLLVLILLRCFASGQDTVRINHTYYTSIFDTVKHIPFLVTYTLTREMLSCDNRIERNKRFTKDPALPSATNLEQDYKRSGCDRRHNMSAEDNACNAEGMKECFYYSNVFPQTHTLNAGSWEQLENQERKEAVQYGSVKVYIGSIGAKGTIGSDNVIVPAYCWKVIFANGKYEAYLFPNDSTVSGPPDAFRTTVEKIEQQSGVHIPQ
jgi:endonuclease G